jgi:hypothetical protein
MKIILIVDIRGGDQSAADRIAAQTGATKLLRAAHSLPYYFGATVEIKED